MTVLSLLSRKSPSTLRQLGGAYIQDYCGRFGHFGRTVLANIEYKALQQGLVWTMIFGLCLAKGVLRCCEVGLAKGCCGGARLVLQRKQLLCFIAGHWSSCKQFFVKIIEQGKWHSNGLQGRFACSMPPFRPHRAGERPFYATVQPISLLDVLHERNVIAYP